MDNIDQVLDQLDDIAIPIVNRGAMVGCALGVVRDGELVATRSYGVADVESRRPVTPDTVFRIGSITKTMTGIALMQLVEQGRLSLEDPVAEHVRGFAIVQPEGARKMTVRDLMTHTAGFGELRSLVDILQGGTVGLGVKHGDPVPALSEYYAKGLRAEVEPGRKWAYANHGVAALGQLVEEVSGESFADYLREHVFAPLGMDTTDVLRTDRVTPGLATGYVLKGGRLKAVPDMEIVVAGAGSVFSTVHDMARYAAALTSGGGNAAGKVLGAETLEEMYAQHWTPDPRLPGQGLLFLREEAGGHRIIHHDGGWPGFTSAMHLAPDERLGVVAFTNGGTPAIHGLADTVLRRLLGVPALGEDLPRSDIVHSPHLWDELSGIYTPPRGFLTNLRAWMMLGGELEVLVKDGALVARGPFGALRSGVPLHPVDPDDPLVFEAVMEQQGLRVPLRLAFQRGASGQVDGVAGQALLPIRFDKRSALRSTRTLARAAAVAVGAGLALARWRR